METLEQLQLLIDDAPTGATHISNLKGDIRYLKHNIRGEFIYSLNNSWCAFTIKSQYLKKCIKIRLISDIERIIELEKKLAEIRFNLNHGVKCSNIPNDLAM